MKNKDSNIHLVVLTCPNCQASSGVAIDLNSEDNKLNCKKCGVITEITIDR